MKIGITERGDAGINLSWVDKVDMVDGMILITKNITKDFALKVLELHKKGYKIIVHCTCTGYGGTEIEPNVPSYESQLFALASLIHEGFPAENCVLRIDPIFPVKGGLNRVRNLISYFMALDTGVTRIRVSIVDEYPHVRERYSKLGIPTLYNGNFGPSSEQIEMVATCLNDYDFTYEICAENELSKRLRNCEVIGCVSNKDLTLMHLPIIETTINPQKRNGCHCLSCKYELFEKRQPCPHGCVYCFWKD